MKPTGNRLLVKVENKELKEGETAVAVMKAEVMGIGPDVKVIKVKDNVIFAPFGIDEVVVGDEKMLILGEDQVIATDE